MLKITNDGLTRSGGTGCFIAVSIWQQWASKGYIGSPKLVKTDKKRLQHTHAVDQFSDHSVWNSGRILLADSVQLVAEIQLSRQRSDDVHVETVESVVSGPRSSATVVFNHEKWSVLQSNTNLRIDHVSIGIH